MPPIFRPATPRAAVTAPGPPAITRPGPLKKPQFASNQEEEEPMNRNVIETVLGAVVLLVGALFLAFAYNSADLNKSQEGYLLSAEFDRIDGLKPGTDVRMN